MSTLTAENIPVLIRQLLSAEHTRLSELPAQEKAEANKAKPPLDKRVPAMPMPDRTREDQWVKEHKHEYAGQWVALDGDRLVAASTIQQEVWDAVDTDGSTLPLVLRIPSPDDLHLTARLVTKPAAGHH